MISESENISTSSRASSLSRWVPVFVVFAALAVYLYVSRPAGALEGWTEDYNAALVRARDTDRHLVLYFHTDFCAPCSAMERSVLGQPKVVAALKAFVPVRLDASRRADLAALFGVYGTPSFVVSSPAGEVLGQTAGYRGVDDFVRFLRQAEAKKERPAPGESAEAAPPDDL